ncbi:MAG TPA: transposase [Tissierellaceae bacterium]|nr:transposase [Tissierellaceae bacterium]
MARKKRRHATYKDWITNEGLLQLEGWARDGLINKQIAHNIGIAEGTLYNWINKYSEISESLKKGKEVVDREVENALLKRALGYEYEEVQTTIEDIDGKQRKKIIKTKRHIPSDTTAIAIWLNNRKPDDWKRNRGKEDLDKERFEEEKRINGIKHW